MGTKAFNRERRGKPSHREDLRAELLAAAVSYVIREGHEGLSMRRLAEEVGVSSAAPYHHFPDRRALLTAVALEGYRQMFDETAVGDSDLKPTDKGEDTTLFKTFMGFIRFARGNPNLFTLMYESELVRPTLSPELAQAQDLGFQSLRREVARRALHLSEEERAVRIATIWSAIFGFALQSNRAMLRAHPLEPAPDDLAPQVVRQALRLLA
ncbi:TetR/AcrR family transcriptional regulator [Novosphingobium mathurense]|uniref:Transcriptional regulator, TetR family n=2 Tax=Novosphingobium TaxID=165696 RepID=A0A1U6IMM5_9SPHN|nr:TetR/AcrR family transcriptional regulator [Novosphingobium mathurense]CDO37952.1 Transcriptional regulator, TetR family [Novosphingobium sp. KN65.2]SLK09281.1 transcriptional regulator, TetR family [Novosphingobium mathurense]